MFLLLHVVVVIVFVVVYFVDDHLKLHVYQFSSSSHITRLTKETRITLITTNYQLKLSRSNKSDGDTD